MKGILFDADDTLYDQTQPFMRAYQELCAGKYEVDAELLFKRSRYYSNQIYHKYVSGEWTLDEVGSYRMIKAFAEQKVTYPEEEALKFQQRYCNYQHHIRLSDQMREILNYCHQHAKTGIITNGVSEHQWKKLETMDVYEMIPKECIIVSGDQNIHKPDPRIFEDAAKRLGLEKKDLIFVGDSYEHDVVGAKRAGWMSIWMNRREHELPQGAYRPDRIVRSEEALFAEIKKLLGQEKVC